MYELVKSPRAKGDLKNIWHESFETWGEDTATAYLLQLDKGMQRLRQSPNMGKPRDQIRAGYHSIRVNRHLIYYRIIEQKIDIVRVLHDRMQPENHL